jgi:hypothetical protein
MADDADQADLAEGTDQFWKMIHETPCTPGQEPA